MSSFSGAIFNAEGAKKGVAIHADGEPTRSSWGRFGKRVYAEFRVMPSRVRPAVAEHPRRCGSLGIIRGRRGRPGACRQPGNGRVCPASVPASGVGGASERITYVRPCRATCRGTLLFCDIYLRQKSARSAWSLVAVAELRSCATALQLLVRSGLHRFSVRLLPGPQIMEQRRAGCLGMGKHFTLQLQHECPAASPRERPARHRTPACAAGLWGRSGQP